MKRLWIKLYLELLDDAKIYRLPVWLRWRFIELLLVAAESDQNGLLPTVTQTAWRLRVSEDDLIKSLRTLSDIGVICQQGDRLKVTNFGKRQSAISGAERVARHRARKRASAVTAAVTTSYRAAVTESYSPLPLTGGEGAGGGGDQGDSQPAPRPPDLIEQYARLNAERRGTGEQA